MKIEKVRKMVEKVIEEGKFALDSFEAGHEMTELELERLLVDNFVLPLDQLLDALRSQCK